MEFLCCLTKDLFVNPRHTPRHRAQQASRCRIVDAAWIATGKLMNQILHSFIEDLHVTAATPNRVVDVPACLIFRKGLQLISNAHPIDDIRVLRRA